MATINFRTEFFRLMRFGIVGGLSAALVFVGYTVLSRYLWPSGPKSLMYAIVVLVVTVLNYEANRHFTFRHGERSVTSMGRFVMVAAVAFALNTLLFSIGVHRLHIHDQVMVILNAGLIAGFTFCSHRFFTFRHGRMRTEQALSDTIVV